MKTLSLGVGKNLERILWLFMYAIYINHTYVHSREQNQYVNYYHCIWPAYRYRHILKLCEKAHESGKQSEYQNRICKIPQKVSHTFFLLIPVFKYLHRLVTFTIKQKIILQWLWFCTWNYNVNHVQPKFVDDRSIQITCKLLVFLFMNATSYWCSIAGACITMKISCENPD